MEGELNVIVIEGQIGVGKTTLGTFLSEKLSIPLFRELNNQMTLDLLDKFYADQYRWSFTMQIHFLNERFRMIKDIFKKGGGILDRSLFGDRVFAEILYKQGKMSKEEYINYTTLLENMLEHAQNPTLLLYLDSSVDSAIKKITQRNRGLEANIPKDYLDMLNDHYLSWYEGYNYSPKVCLDYNDFDIFREKDQKKVLDLISPYLNK